MGNIAVIGHKGSGKTTFLAGLAYWPKRPQALKKSSHYQIQPIGSDATELQQKAENIITKGDSFEPTNIHGGVDALPAYQFQIKIKNETINLVFEDYGGEIFEGLNTRKIEMKHQEFLDKCLMKDVCGCLLLLSGWQRSDDNVYSQNLQAFINLLTANDRLKNYRMAVGMSKCERGELWPGKIEPEIDIFQTHLPRTKSILEKNIPANNLKFFAISTFGVLERTDPRPNRIIIENDDTAAVLRDADAWNPYNIIAPMYWLDTGKVIKPDS